MKTVITALNSKYIHMSLAPWYLKAYCGERFDISVLECTINQEVRKIVTSIFNQKPDIVGFSCYIFNIELVEKVLQDLKKVLPNIKIILGGPEVSYNAKEMLEKLPDVDFVICGEGEKPFKALLGCLEKNNQTFYKDISGLVYREGSRIVENPPEALSGEIDTVSPYTDEMLYAAKGKIIYFESSRGCPFRCAYCLSSASGGARFMPMEQVKKDLARIMASDVRQVKFVDRTFNCNLKRAKEITRFIIEQANTDKTGKTAEKNYHFEVSADIFDEEYLGLLSSTPKGLIQFEIGIQSFNEKTLEEVGRKTDIAICSRNIKRLLENRNIHIHLDLIAGLPGENFDSFGRSFDGVYQLRPHTIQLGFLKLLYGSKMRYDADNKYDGKYRYCSYSPYEVLQSPELSFNDICKLKMVEEAVDRLYNSGKFIYSLDYMIKHSSSPFQFFNEFSEFLKQNGGFEVSLSLKDIYIIFDNFACAKLDSSKYKVFCELLKFDYFVTDNSCNPPHCLKRQNDPHLKLLYHKMKREYPFHLETFSIDIIQYIKNNDVEIKKILICFDYHEKDKVTGQYDYERIADQNIVEI